MVMRLIARKTVREFWERPGCGDAEQPLRAWVDEAEKGDWRKPQDIKARFGTASFVANHRVVFNIAGNKYRLVVAVRYDKAILFVRFIGTHQAYDRIDASKV
jgi:mRNA interferase HigB